MTRSFVRWWNGFRWFRRCQMCGSRGACHYHQRTQYVDEKSNWVNLCPPCKEINDDHWDYMWAEYWGSHL
jgi:transcription elongation factor Elf1